MVTMFCSRPSTKTVPSCLCVKHIQLGKKSSLSLYTCVRQSNMVIDMAHGPWFDDGEATITNHAPPSSYHIRSLKPRLINVFSKSLDFNYECFTCPHNTEDRLLWKAWVNLFQKYFNFLLIIWACHVTPNHKIDFGLPRDLSTCCLIFDFFETRSPSKWRSTFFSHYITRWRSIIGRTQNILASI